MNKCSKHKICFIISLCFMISGAHYASAALLDNLPSKRSHIKLFRNFGTAYETIRNGYDLSFNIEVKETDTEHVALNYELNTTMILPSQKSEQLKQWWCQGRSNCDIPEQMFLHFRDDTTISLPPDNNTFDQWTCTVRGWDPANDLDNDGTLSEYEWNNRTNHNSSARNMFEARVPVYYWGDFWNHYCGTEQVDHHSDFAMNVSNVDYQDFMATEYIPYVLNRAPDSDGIYFDTSMGYWELWMWTPISGYVEFADEEAYISGIRDLMFVIEQNMSDDKIIIGNGWINSSQTIEGAQQEVWLNISHPARKFLAAVDLVRENLKDGSINLVQFNPTYDEHYASTGSRAPVTRERDQIYALASYYLAAGDRSYFSYGNHPYHDDGNLLFDAIDFDVGYALGDYFFHAIDTDESGDNLLFNGNFETKDTSSTPAGWSLSAPETVTVAQDTECGLNGQCVKIKSPATSNHLNTQQVILQPQTTYTLSGFIRTEAVSGENGYFGANFYPYDFVDSAPPMTSCSMSLRGTHDWQFTHCNFTTGTDVRGNIKFRIQNGSGTAWFDSLQLKKGLPRIVLAREYSKALILVRPRSSEDSGYDDPAVYTFDKVYRRVNADGSYAEPSHSVTLRSGEAAILSCTYRNGNDYIAGADCLNTAPAAPTNLIFTDL